MSPSGPEAVRKIVGQATEANLEPPRPLIRELPPADPFPVNALGDVLEAATRAINDRVRSPMAICGQSTLAAATLAVQGHADNELPTGQAKPILNFFISIAATGLRKTATDSEALWPVRKRENALRQDYDRALPDYTNAMMAFEKVRDQVVRRHAKKANRAELESALEALGPSPIAPLTPMLTCPEPTYEGLCKHLVSGRPSIGIFSAEGGQFIGGHGMAQEAKLRTVTGLSCLWDGEVIKRVRALDGATILPGRRVAVHLMAQPDVAALMLSDPVLINQGLLSRCLVTAPESNAGTRTWREASTASDLAIKRYGGRILDILEKQLPLAAGKTNELSPRILQLAPDARKMWIAFADNIEGQIGPDGALGPVSGLANKLPEHAARLASVLMLVEDIDACEVSAEKMSAGIILAQHYAAEALRMFEGSRISGDLLLAQKLLGWLNQSWNERAISLPDIYQKGPNAIRDKATAVKLVRILEDHGWLHRIDGAALIAGHHRREAWLVIKG
jgi:hypothetical protein